MNEYDAELLNEMTLLNNLRIAQLINSQFLEMFLGAIRDVPWKLAIKLSIRCVRMYCDDKYYNAEIKLTEKRIAELIESKRETEP